ncbi:acyltransferase [Methylococcus sp. EFPC2]|uniref:acyltransferase n=1 Tax=Methylococcus sp. EFPC2 TaxID=2812648 RepID=UPI001966FD9B|nr:acyltransferase [Methylococcus sp. EFPC2]QSA96746.1 acyltransferase [Methylococcus sp. EFPC2]
MRIRSIDTLKGLAIIAVVIIHTEPFIATASMKGDWYYLGQSLQQLSSFAVPFFFVAAGYFYSRGISKESILSRWLKYTSRLASLLLIWTIIDGIFWGPWLEQMIKAKSAAPLLWNLNALPSFAAKRPDLFFFRGTAVPLWFLVSLIAGISLLALCLKLSLRPPALLAIGFSAYALCLATSSYEATFLGFGLTLPLEQRGPLIAFSFLTVGHFFAAHNISTKHSAPFLATAVIMIFCESALLSHLSGLPFQERPYLFSSLPLAACAFLFATSHPNLGANSVLSALGSRSLGIYLIHTPVLGAVSLIRRAVVHPIWEIIFALLVISLSYGLVALLMRIPYIRKSVI